MAYLTSLHKFVGESQGIAKTTRGGGKNYIFHIRNRGSIGLIKIMFKWVE